MKKIDVLGIAFGNFQRRKTRSILSVLGVMIGTASIVTMMSLGIAVNIQFQENMKNYGNINEIRVYASWDDQTGQENKLTDDVVDEIEQLEHVQAISPVVRLSGKVFSGKMQSYADIQGVDFGYLKAVGTGMKQGRMPTGEDLSSAKNVYCVMGASVPYEFYNTGSYSGTSMGGGETIEGEAWRYDGQIFDENGNVIGTYPPEIDVLDENTRVRYTPDWSYGENYPGQELSAGRKAPLYNLMTLGILEKGSDDYSIYISLEDALRLQKETEKWQNNQNTATGIPTAQKKAEISYEQILVLSDDLENTLELTESIRQLGYGASSSADWITQLQDQQNMLQMLLGGIGSVALLVAAIGITNTMVMSIYERTREIGIMKVIGCYLKDIRTMFLAEAALIGLFGGVLGVGLSFIVSALLNFAVGDGGILGMGGGSAMSVIPWWLAILAIAFSVFVALVSGFFPARRAMRLSALEAMRT